MMMLIILQFFTDPKFVGKFFDENEKYSVKAYDKEKGKWVESEFYFKDLKDFVNVNISLTPEQAEKLYNNILIDFENYEILCKDEIIKEELSKLKSLYTETKRDYQFTSYSSTTRMPNIIGQCVNEINKSLVGMLVEIESNYKNMDAALTSWQALEEEESKKVEAIEDAPTNPSSSVTNSNSSPSSGVVSGSVPSGSQPSSQSKPNPTPTPSTKPTPEPTPSPKPSTGNEPQSKPSPSSKPSMGENTPSEPNENNEPPRIGEDNPNYDIKNDFPKYDELISDEYREVYDSGEDYKIVIHHRGEEIIGVEHYYEFVDENTAQNKYDAIVAKYMYVDNSEKVIIDNNHIKVLFSNKMYEGQTFSEFNKNYDQYQKVIK